MATHAVIVCMVLFSALVTICYGAGISFATLNKTLVVESSPLNQVLKGGKDNITVTWSLNSTAAGGDTAYKTVSVKLCYAPISQKQRGWRKTEDHLNKDRTCQHKLVTRPYSASSNTFTMVISKDVPSATYFVRAYVLDEHHHEVAYGQSTDAKKTTNLFEVEAISGRHLSMDIASICFSAFSVLSLAGFFWMEKRSAKTK
jgi:hypothetical protein